MGTTYGHGISGHVQSERYCTGPGCANGQRVFRAHLLPTEKTAGEGASRLEWWSERLAERVISEARAPLWPRSGPAGRHDLSIICCTSCREYCGLNFHVINAEVTGAILHRGMYVTMLHLLGPLGLAVYCWTTVIDAELPEIWQPAMLIVFE